MAELAVQNVTHTLDQIIDSLNPFITERIPLTPELVRDLRDLLTVVRNCAINLADAERAVADVTPPLTLASGVVLTFPGMHD